MSFIFLYLLKLSICLAVVFLFYYCILRRLTFYNWNRCYLFVYTLLGFYIPFIDVTGLLQQSELQSVKIMQWVPAVNHYTNPTNTGTALPFNNILLVLLLAGMLIALGRLCRQFISFRQLKKKAQLVHDNEMTIYQVDADIIPFSFGNAIFINRQLHTETELQDIILHEFVHVKQQHSLDIIWSELLCVVNWYNPFAWLLKKAIRQNLEFIADDKVLQQGISKKAYQYLLLKVTGNNQYSIGTQFNFSSLKKRIAMMNKMKTTRLHLVKFLFLLPMLSVLLLAFRNEWRVPASAQGNNLQPTIEGLAKTTSGFSATVSPQNPANQQVEQLLEKKPAPAITASVDTVVVPDDEVNNKGYFIEVMTSNHKTIVVVTDKDHKEVKRLSMAEWNKQRQYYEGLYGELPPPPPPPPLPPTPPAGPGLAPTPPLPTLAPEAPTPPMPPGAPNELLPPLPPAPPPPPALPDNVRRLTIDNHSATVWLKNGKKETYDLDNAAQKQQFESTYRPLPPTPKPTVTL